MAFPTPPQRGSIPDKSASTAPEETKKITTDDVSTILDMELHPAHRDDPTVLKFINAYLTTNNLRESANAADIDIRSARTLRSRKDIHTAMTKIRDVAFLKFGLDANEIVEAAKEVAFFDIADLVNKDGTVKSNVHDIPVHARRAIRKIKIKNVYEPDINGIKVKVGYITEIDMWDKMKAIEKLGNEKGLFKETIKQEFEVGDNMKEVLLGSKDRAAARLERLRNREEIDVSPNSTAGPRDRISEPGDRGNNGSNGEKSSNDGGIFKESANTIRIPGGSGEVGSEPTGETQK